MAPKQKKPKKYKISPHFFPLKKIQKSHTKKKQKWPTVIPLKIQNTPKILQKDPKFLLSRSFVKFGDFFCIFGNIFELFEGFS
jgi:hypothetical protein